MPNPPAPAVEPTLPLSPFIGQGGSQTPGDIDKIVEKIGSTLLKPTKYTCTLRKPDLTGVAGEPVQFDLAESTTLPGRSLATIQRRIWGPIYDIPYERLYSGDIELVLILTKDTIDKHRNYFSKWMDLIISGNSLMWTDRDVYTGQLVIDLEDDSGNPCHSVEINEVYPKSIQPISLNYNSVNDYIRQSITFSYRTWKSEELTGPPAPGGGGGGGYQGPVIG